jgi:peptide/nickel transport system substrate-binding protein
LRGGVLIAAAGALLLAATAGVVAKLAGSGTPTVAVAPNSVAEIDVGSGRVVAAATVGVRPGSIAFGSGSLWIANLDDQTISRVDPHSLRTLKNITLREPPTGVAASSAGVWVVESNPNSDQNLRSSVSVIRIDPEFDTPGAPVRIGNVVPDGSGVVAAQGSSVWVAPSNGLLTRLDARTGTRHQQDPNASPSGIALGDGAVWLTDSEANNVIRRDATGLLTPIPVGNGPTAIAFGEGGVWVVDSLDESVVRIDPSTGSVTREIPVGRSPTGVAVGAGSVWVANSGDGTITRIDPGTGKRSTIRVGGSPQALTVANGRVWVTVGARPIALANAGPGGRTLRIVSFSDVDSLDPALAYDPLSLQLVYATCARLLNYPDLPGAAGSQLTPEVAQALPKRSHDGRTYRFTIRPGFRFSPPLNQPVTAQTFKDSIERTLAPGMQSPFARYMADVVGARRYTAGRASHITGIVARGDKLTIRLTSPVGDFPYRIALSGFCAVPPHTPVERTGLPMIPSAGPYYISSYAPGRGVVLSRNPNYHGNRPHHFARIELAVGILAARAADQIETGAADYMTIGPWSYPSTTATTALLSRLSSRYGEHSDAAARGKQRFFANPTLELDYLALNTHRSLFRDLRLRQAINYAINRRALAAIASGYGPEPTTDHYLPPGMSGYRSARLYPTRPDLARARQLVRSADARHRTAVLYTFDAEPAPQTAQIVKNNLEAIGIHVQIKTFPVATMFSRLDRPGEPFDLANAPWFADYPDPSQMLNVLLDGSAGVLPSFADPGYQRRLAAAARLTGPQRYLAYGALDLDLARNAAPLAAFGNNPSYDFFSARIGCQTYGVYGMDLLALCTNAPGQR